MNHTPGPWHDEEIAMEMRQEGPYAVIRDSEDNVIAYLPKGANVHIVTAAPDLLEALRFAEIALSEVSTDRSEVLMGVRAAIAKATAAPAAKESAADDQII